MAPGARSRPAVSRPWHTLWGGLMFAVLTDGVVPSINDIFGVSKQTEVCDFYKPVGKRIEVYDDTTYGRCALDPKITCCVFTKEVVILTEKAWSAEGEFFRSMNCTRSVRPFCEAQCFRTTKVLVPADNIERTALVLPRTSPFFNDRFATSSKHHYRMVFVRVEVYNAFNFDILSGSAQISNNPTGGSAATGVEILNLGVSFVDSKTSIGTWEFYESKVFGVCGVLPTFFLALIQDSFGRYQNSTSYPREAYPTEDSTEYYPYQYSGVHTETVFLVNSGQIGPSQIGRNETEGLPPYQEVLRDFPIKNDKGEIAWGAIYSSIDSDLICCEAHCNNDERKCPKYPECEVQLYGDGGAVPWEVAEGGEVRHGGRVYSLHPKKQAHAEAAAECARNLDGRLASFPDRVAYYSVLELLFSGQDAKALHNELITKSTHQMIWVDGTVSDTGSVATAEPAVFEPELELSSTDYPCLLTPENLRFGSQHQLFKPEVAGHCAAVSLFNLMASTRPCEAELPFICMQDVPSEEVDAGGSKAKEAGHLGMGWIVGGVAIVIVCAAAAVFLYQRRRPLQERVPLASQTPVPSGVALQPNTRKGEMVSMISSLPNNMKLQEGFSTWQMELNEGGWLHNNGTHNNKESMLNSVRQIMETSQVISKTRQSSTQTLSTTRNSELWEQDTKSLSTASPLTRTASCKSLGKESYVEMNSPGSGARGFKPTTSDLMNGYTNFRPLGNTRDTGLRFCVEEVATGLKWVMKIPNEEDHESSVREACLLTMLRHPNVIHHKDLLADGSRLISVVEYCEYGSVSDLMSKVEALPEKLIRIIFSHVLLAVAHLHHHGVAHRDIKTKNVFINAAGIVKLGNFNSGRVLVDTTESFVGTPYHMAPEIVAGEPYTKECDIWSLGSFLYHMCMMTPAFSMAKSLEHLQDIHAKKLDLAPVRERYSKELVDLMEDMLNLGHEQRPAAVDMLNLPWMLEGVQSDCASVICSELPSLLQSPLDEVTLTITETCTMYDGNPP